MKTKTLSIILILFMNQLIAQTIIRGKVQDEKNNPLEFVNVLLFKSSNQEFVKGAVTNSKGEFEFEKVNTGKYFIKTSMIGFVEFKSNEINITEGNSTPFILNILMKEDIEMLQEVSIEAEKPLYEQKIDRTVVNVQSSVTSTGSTALQVLQRSPGIDVDNINNSISMMGKQGVIIMLNGKRMRMEGEALIQLLKSMPSDNIDKIELISSPPASYDAEGDAGVINIETLSKEDEGSQSNISLNTGYGIKPKFGGSYNIHYRKNKLSLYADFSGNHNFTQQDFKISRRNVFQNQITTTDVNSSRPATEGLYSGRLGLDYQISNKTSVGLVLSAYYRHWGLDASTDTHIKDNLLGDSLSVLKAKEKNDWTHGMGNFNLTHKITNDDRLSFDFDYLYYKDDNPTNYLEYIYNESDELTTTNEFTSDKQTPISFYVSKIDYNKKWSDKLRTQIGVKATFSKFTNDVSVSNLRAGNWVNDPRFTDVYFLDESIKAAYLSSDYKVNEKITAKLGVRYEYYDSDLGSELEGDLLVQRFGRFFPSAFLTYKFNKESQIQFSYNERISRPGFNNIAPAFFFLGYNSILGGNPAVRPTISKKLGVNFRIKELMVNFQYANDRNPLVYQPTIIAEENLLITRVENMSKRETAMISVNFPVQLTDWWESRYTITTYWQKMAPIFEGENIGVETNFYIINTTQKFTLPKDFSLEMNANIRSKRDYGLGKIPLRASVNLGLQKKVNENLRLTFNWNDMFNMGSFFEIDYNQPNINLDYIWNYDMEGNIFRFSVSWQLGNKKLKKMEKRKTGSEEESGRVN